MELEVGWRDCEGAQLAFVRSAEGPRSSQAPLEGHLIESFCFPHFYVTALFDSIPLGSASVHISINEDNGMCSSMRMRHPKLVHYGIATSHAHQWSYPPHNSYFSRPFEHEKLFCADLDLASFESEILGVSFVVQLEDGTWLKKGNNDFYIGGGIRSVPCFVEVPFRLPENLQVLPGKMLSLFRANPFWLQPSMNGDGLQSCKQETQFVLAKCNMTSPLIGSEPGHSDIFLTLVPLVDPELEIRASLFGVENGFYAAIRLENGRCSPLRLHDVLNAKVCILARSTSPYDSVRFAVEHASSVLKTFSSRSRKLMSRRCQELISSTRKGILNSIGFCTWDAFGHEVSSENVLDAFDWLKAEGLPVSYVIIDDGWQAGGSAGPSAENTSPLHGCTHRPTLTSFNANSKFSGSLRYLKEYSGLEVYAWTALIGYWGGSSGRDCGTRTMNVRGALPHGLFENGVESPSYWEKDYEVVVPEVELVEQYFASYFLRSMSHEQDICGVKVDAQSILEILCNEKPETGQGMRITRSSITHTFRNAMTKAVESAFPRTIVLNCMACGPETIFYSGANLSVANVCWRTSNDHAFPDSDEDANSVCWHIICNAMTTILLGEIFLVTDWDMFQAANEYSDLHAAARLLSGGPVYISDTTPFPTCHASRAKQLLEGMLTSNGSLLRCVNPGRPTAGSLFQDPRASPTHFFKIFNRNAVLGIVGLFNLCQDSLQLVTDVFAPSDVEDFARAPGSCGYISLVTGTETSAFHHRDSSHCCEVTLPPLSVALAHISPVFRLGTSLQFAVLGQPRLRNCGSVVNSISIRSDHQCLTGRDKFLVEIHLQDGGETYFWVDDRSQNCLAVRSGDGNVIEVNTVDVDKVKFLAISVPYAKPHIVQFSLIDTT